MFNYIQGDFPKDMVFEDNHIQWEISFTDRVGLQGNIEQLEVLPEKEEGVISVVCYLKDGRHFLADVDEDTYQQLQVAKEGEYVGLKRMSKKKKIVGGIVATVLAGLVAALGAIGLKRRKS